MFGINYALLGFFMYIKKTCSKTIIFKISGVERARKPRFASEKMVAKGDVSTMPRDFEDSGVLELLCCLL